MVVFVAYQKELYCDSECILYHSLGMIKTLSSGSSKLNKYTIRIYNVSHASLVTHHFCV